MYSMFSYKYGTSILHKCPAWLKILIVPVISIAALSLPAPFCIALIGIQFITALLLKFSLKEQFKDIKPIFYYAFLLYVFKFISILISGSSLTWTDEKETIFMLLKILCLLQTASLMFKTSTSLQIREGFAVIEEFFQKIFSKNNKISYYFTNTLSMFINFIPMVSSVWNQEKRAWKARCGKPTIKMYISLLQVLLSVCMKKAWNTARAIQIRSV